MIVTPATPKDADEIAALVNSAYRGETSRFGWTTEADYLDGARISRASAAYLIQPEFGKTVLVLREQEDRPIIGCVSLEKSQDENDPGNCYLGMLTVHPKRQDRGLGRLLLDQAEKFAAAWGAQKMTLGVIQLRGTLIAWYERRGYRRTPVTKPFPYDDPEVGTPKRRDLSFVMFEKILSKDQP